MPALFARGQSSDYLRSKRESVERTIAAATAAELDAAGAAEKWRQMAFTDPVEMKVAEATITVDETHVQFGNRSPFGGPSRPVDGVKVVVRVPFDGDAHLLEYRPSTWTSIPPQGAVENQRVVLTVEVPGRDSEAIKRWRADEMKKLETWVSFANADAATFNANLSATVEAAMASRRQTLAELQRLRDDLA
jgi:hypothetical protein